MKGTLDAACWGFPFGDIPAGSPFKKSICQVSTPQEPLGGSVEPWPSGFYPTIPVRKTILGREVKVLCQSTDPFPTMYFDSCPKTGRREAPSCMQAAMRHHQWQKRRPRRQKKRQGWKRRESALRLAFCVCVCVPFLTLFGICLGICCASLSMLPLGLLGLFRMPSFCLLSRLCRILSLVSTCFADAFVALR